MKRTIELPENVEAEKVDGAILIKGEDENVEKKLNHPLIAVDCDHDKITVETKKENKKTRSIARTFESKLRSAVKGEQENFEYKLKVVYKHFPMEAKVQGNKLVVSNFLGEKMNREADILEGVKVKVQDEHITVTGADKERAGQTAANIERNMQAPNKKDRRVFEDGIYIVEKPSGD